MPFTLLLNPKARKELDSPEFAERPKIVAVLDVIARDPFAGKKLGGKYKNQRSMYAWPFRILYEIRSRERVLLVMRIRHRKDAYR